LGIDYKRNHSKILVKLKGCTLVITGLVMFSFSSFQQQIFKETKRIVFVFLVPPKLKRERERDRERERERERKKERKKERVFHVNVSYLTIKI